MFNEIKSKKLVAFIFVFFISCVTAIYYYGNISDSLFWGVIVGTGGVGLEVFHVVLALEVKNISLSTRKFRFRHLRIYALYVSLASMAVMSTFMCLIVNIESKSIKQRIPQMKIEIMKKRISILEKSSFENNDKRKIYDLLHSDTNEWAALALLKEAKSREELLSKRMILLDKCKMELADLEVQAFGVKSGFKLLAETLNSPNSTNKFMLLSALFFSVMSVVAMGRTVDGLDKLFPRRKSSVSRGRRKKLPKEQLNLWG